MHGFLAALGLSAVLPPARHQAPVVVAQIEVKRFQCTPLESPRIGGESACGWIKDRHYLMLLQLPMLKARKRSALTAIPACST